MQFMLLLKGDPPADAPPNVELFAAMGAYLQELTDAGVLLGAEGLFPSTTATRVVYRGGRRTYVDGPFAEAKELIAGYFIIDVKSAEEAVEWAARCPVHLAVGDDEEAVVEVRRIAQGVEEVFPELAG